MKMIREVMDHWRSDWQENRPRFWFESMGTLLSILGTGTLSVMAGSPPLLFCYVAWLMGSSLMLVGARMRRASWMFLLMLFNTVMNIVGLSILVLD